MFSITIYISSIQLEDIRKFWVQKITQEKSTKFIKIFEQYQIFMYKFLCQNDIIPTICILPMRTGSNPLTFNTFQVYE